ncbi:hypothetical protein [Deinococcus fonticola]|nr:hypothetical protein [Deinococcus fonticola]
MVGDAKGELDPARFRDHQLQEVVGPKGEAEALDLPGGMAFDS